MTGSTVIRNFLKVKNIERVRLLSPYTKEFPEFSVPKHVYLEILSA